MAPKGDSKVLLFYEVFHYFRKKINKPLDCSGVGPHISIDRACKRNGRLGHCINAVIIR